MTICIAMLPKNALRREALVRIVRLDGASLHGLSYGRLPSSIHSDWAACQWPETCLKHLEPTDQVHADSGQVREEFWNQATTKTAESGSQNSLPFGTAHALKLRQSSLEPTGTIPGTGTHETYAVVRRAFTSPTPCPSLSPSP